MYITHFSLVAFSGGSHYICLHYRNNEQVIGRIHDFLSIIQLIDHNGRYRCRWHINQLSLNTTFHVISNETCITPLCITDRDELLFFLYLCICCGFFLMLTNDLYLDLCPLDMLTHFLVCAAVVISSSRSVVPMGHPDNFIYSV